MLIRGKLAAMFFAVLIQSNHGLMFRDAGVVERIRVWLYALRVNYGAVKIGLCLFSRLDCLNELLRKVVTIWAWNSIGHPNILQKNLCTLFIRATPQYPTRDP
jgi:hypothetical protein